MPIREWMRDYAPGGALVVGLVGFWVLAWLAGPVDDTGYPKELAEGLGVLLAALALFLTLSREGSRQASASVTAEAQRVHDAALSRHMPPSPHTTFVQTAREGLQMWEDVDRVAKIAADEDNNLEFAVRHAHRVEEWYRERSDLMLRLAFIRAPISATTEVSEKERARRRKNEKQIEEDLRHVDDNWKRVTEALGQRSTDRIAVPALYGLVATMSTIALARWFLGAMVVLYLAGALWAGPSWQLLESPALWLATIVVALGATYVWGVTRMIRLDQDALLHQLRRRPLVVLAQVEKMAAFSADLDSVVSKIPDDFSWRLTLVEQEVPDLPWLHSLRGRLHLAQALHQGDSHAFAAAEHDLRRALVDSADPFAAVALARLLQEHGNPSDAEEATRLTADAERGIRQAVEHDRMRSLNETALSDTDQVVWWLDRQRWYWPQSLLDKIGDERIH